MGDSSQGHTSIVRVILVVRMVVVMPIVLKVAVLSLIYQSILILKIRFFKREWLSTIH